MGNRLLSLEKRLQGAGLGGKVSMAKSYFGMALALHDNYTYELYTATADIDIADVIRSKWSFTKGNDRQDSKTAFMVRMVKSYNPTKSITVPKNLKLKKDEKIYVPTAYQFDEKYKDKTIQGSVFPDDPISSSKTVTLGTDITTDYLPALERAIGTEPKGLRLLCTVFTKQEGFKKGTRSYTNNNPGNIGNTDSGANRSFDTLDAGILAQKDYFTSVAGGTHKAYPIGTKKKIPPFYSPEIAKNFENYQLSPYVPGYEFTYTGQLDQFIKIYATGARSGNGYLSTIISYFKANGLTISETSTIQDIIKMN